MTSINAPGNSSASHVEYVADGIRTAFTFPFQISTILDMEVFLGVVKHADYAVPQAAYTVTGVGAPGGGIVRFSVPPAAWAAVTLRRRSAATCTSGFLDY